MKLITLQRIAQNDFGTFGVLLWNNIPQMVTLENLWVANRLNLSCIPKGEYFVVRCKDSAEYEFQDSPKFGDTFNITQVPNRSKILFHAGNTVYDTEGCILVGESFGIVNNKQGIIHSRSALTKLKTLVKPANNFILRIEDKL